MWGLPTSEGRRHGEVERIMRAQPLDFVQVTYNILDRQVVDRILPLARDRGISVIVNRPFREGELLRRLERHPLPGWGAEIGCGKNNRTQFELKEGWKGGSGRPIDLGAGLGRRQDCL